MSAGEVEFRSMNGRSRRSLRAPLFLRGLSLGGGSLLLSACLMTPSEVRDIRRDIVQTKLDVGQLQVSQAESFRKVEYELQQISSNLSQHQETLKAFREEMEREINRLQEDVFRLSAQVGGVATSAGQGAVASGGAGEKAASPGDRILLSAQVEFSRGNYDNAIAGYENFLKENAGSSEAPNAAYQLAKCFYAQEDFKEARARFEKIEMRYPASQIVPHSLHSRALCEIKLERSGAARSILEKLRVLYPDYETQRIQDILEQLQ